MAEKSPGSVSASLIIVIIVAAAIGAVIALILQGAGLSTRAIAIISGFVATIIASIARYKILFLGAGKGPDDFPHTVRRRDLRGYRFYCGKSRGA